MEQGTLGSPSVHLVTMLLGKLCPSLSLLSHVGAIVPGFIHSQGNHRALLDASSVLGSVVGGPL